MPQSGVVTVSLSDHVSHDCPFSRPSLATRLLAHKIQSPQEWEAIQALTVRKDPGVL